MKKDIDNVNLFLSINKNEPDFFKPNQYKYHWCWTKVTSLSIAADIISSSVWSNSIWAVDTRLESEWRASYFAAIDVDSGYSLQQAIKELSDTNHVIGTTKSHGHKGDRFRILIPWSKPIKDINQYRYNIKKITEKYDGDTSACDGARFFWPCKEIVSVNYDKEFYNQDVLEFKTPTKKETVKKYSQYANLKVTPPWVMHALKFGVPDGERNNYIYSISKTLTLCGLEQSKILDLIKSSPIPLASAPEKEIVNAVNNGVRKGLSILDATMGAI